MMIKSNTRRKSGGSLQASTLPMEGDRFELLSSVVRAVRNVVGDRGPVALHEPTFEGRELEYVTDCITSGWVSSVGSYVDRFESMLGEISGGYAVATSNGTAALHIALLLSDVRPTDEVLVPALTFVATANAVSYCGAVPHFVDSAIDNLGIDPEALSIYLAENCDLVGGDCRNRRTGARVRAIVPMHVFGHPVQFRELQAVAAAWNIAVVEDAAEAVGAAYEGAPCGSLGQLGAFSFNGNKVVTTGGGGAIITRDRDLARAAKHLTTTARVPHRWSFDHDQIGFNYRMPNINAALGCAQLEGLEAKLSKKRELVSRYVSAFELIDGISVVLEPAGTRSSYWLVALRLEARLSMMRDPLLDALNDAELMARPVWTLLHKLEIYQDCPRAPLPVAEQLEATLINLPSSPFLVG